MVADLEAVFVELGDLVPGHVVLLVGREVPPLGDEERGPELVLLQKRPGDRVMRLACVVKGQDDKPVRDRFQGADGDGEDEKAGYQQEDTSHESRSRCDGTGRPPRRPTVTEVAGRGY